MKIQNEVMIESANTSFSVCMSVYMNDNASDFITAVKSVYNQTTPPNEIVLVVDGPIGDSLKKAIEHIAEEIPIINVIWLAENCGHAIARQTGMEAAKHGLIAIMDSDDISLPNRFQQQLAVFEENPDVTVVGGLINEFIDDINNVVGMRWVPQTDVDIKQYLKDRCPMNLVTVMFRKDHVQNVGGYIDWYCEEDYYLWIRLALAGYKFYNIQHNLVNVRVGSDMYNRRGGTRYFKSEYALQKLMLEENIITPIKFLSNVVKRFIVQVILPNNIRGWVFRKFARK
ncbi:MAG: glycosyltransferase [Bacteroidaceae bacterium]|nr:glycosyltransferase [Bacteroidaceae bacterium]